MQKPSRSFWRIWPVFRRIPPSFSSHQPEIFNIILPIHVPYTIKSKCLLATQLIVVTTHTYADEFSQFVKAPKQNPITRCSKLKRGLASVLIVARFNMSTSDFFPAYTCRRAGRQDRRTAGPWSRELQRKGHRSTRKGALEEEHHDQLAGAVRGSEHAKGLQSRAGTLWFGDGVRQSAETGAHTQKGRRDGVIV